MTQELGLINGQEAPTTDERVDGVTEHAPDSFKAFIGGYMGESYGIQWKQGKLWYEHFARGYQKQDTTEIEVSAKDWQRFWATLDRLSVWEWDTRYAPDSPICDGTHWSLKIEYEGKSLDASGSNAYPPAFEKLCAAVRRLAGGLPFS